MQTSSDIKTAFDLRIHCHHRKKVELQSRERLSIHRAGDQSNYPDCDSLIGTLQHTGGKLKRLLKPISITRYLDQGKNMLETQNKS